MPLLLPCDKLGESMSHFATTCPTVGHEKRMTVRHTHFILVVQPLGQLWPHLLGQQHHGTKEANHLSEAVVHHPDLLGQQCGDQANTKQVGACNRAQATVKSSSLSLFMCLSLSSDFVSYTTRQLAFPGHPHCLKQQGGYPNSTKH